MTGAVVDRFGPFRSAVSPSEEARVTLFSLLNALRNIGLGMGALTASLGVWVERTPRTSAPKFCARPVHRFRRAEWAPLEDKTVIDTFWERARIRSPAHRVMEVAGMRVHTSCAEELGWSNRPLGVIIAADSSTGYWDRSTGLRWARDRAQFVEGLVALAAISRKVRIAEFVRGVPCSILCMVMPDGVAVFPPLEIVTLGSAAGDLRFCGSSKYWRPGPAAVAEMVFVCRAVGEELARAVSYLGIFSVDGILGADGFLATELNSRHASGLGTRAGLPELPVYLFNRAVQEQLPGFGEMPGVEVEMLISSVVASAPSLALTVPAAAGTKTGQRVVHTSFGSVGVRGRRNAGEGYSAGDAAARRSHGADLCRVVPVVGRPWMVLLPRRSFRMTAMRLVHRRPPHRAADDPGMVCRFDE